MAKGKYLSCSIGFIDSFLSIEITGTKAGFRVAHKCPALVRCFEIAAHLFAAGIPLKCIIDVYEIDQRGNIHDDS